MSHDHTSPSTASADTVDVPPMKRLLDVLREDLHLTGTKEGCGEGECGACAVLLERRAGQLLPRPRAAGRRRDTSAPSKASPPTAASTPSSSASSKKAERSAASALPA